MAVLGLELVLRFLPVPDGAIVGPVTAADPVMHYEPSRDFTWSIGPRLAFATHGHINRLGWASPIEYDSTATTPLLAVVGDSYVEALMVPQNASLGARLSGAGRRVYTFGMSGAPLSQYLAEAQYATRFRPAALIVVVVDNDFDESLARFKPPTGQYAFDTTLALTRTDYTPSRVKRFLRHSALVRYLLYSHLLERRSVPHEIPDRVPWSVKAVRAFLDTLPAMAGLPASRILLVVDGQRPGRPVNQFFGQMRDSLMTRATALGYPVLDLSPVFAADFAVHHQPFEFPTDGHWNSYGHAIVARAITAALWTE